jgi:hypothetical protein
MTSRTLGSNRLWAKACAWLLIGGFLWAAAFATPSQAGDIETRDFNVLVDGKRAGEVHMTIQREDDGTFKMRCDTDIEVRVLLVRYRYSYRGMEVWKDGRLQRFDSTTNDDGKRFVVSAVAEANGLRLNVNNQDRLVNPDVWLTSYWRLPDPKLRQQLVPIIDADTGRDLDARIQLIGPVQLPISGQVQNVNHYHLVGKVDVHVWYDASERLVRQEWVEEGHRTILDLIRVRR